MYYLHVCSKPVSDEAASAIEEEYQSLLRDLCTIETLTKPQCWKVPDFHELLFKLDEIKGNKNDFFETISPVIGTDPMRQGEDIVVWTKNTGTTFTITETEWARLEYCMNEPQFTYGDMVRVKNSAPDRYFPGELFPIVGLSVIKNETMRDSYKSPIGANIYTVELPKGDAIVIPEQYLEFHE